MRGRGVTGVLLASTVDRGQGLFEHELGHMINLHYERLDVGSNYREEESGMGKLTSQAGLISSVEATFPSGKGEPSEAVRQLLAVVMASPKIIDPYKD